MGKELDKEYWLLRETLSAIENNCYDFNQWSALPENITHDKKIIEYLFKHHSDVYFMLPDKYKLDYQYCLTYLNTTDRNSGYGDDFSSIPQQLHTEEFFLYYVNHVLENRRLCSFFSYLDKYYSNIQQSIPSHLIMTGINEKIAVLKYASSKIKNDYSIALQAVKNNYKDFPYVSEQLRNNPLFLYEVIINSDSHLSTSLAIYFGEEFKNSSGLSENNTSQEIIHYLQRFYEQDCLSKKLEATLLQKNNLKKNKV